MLFGPTEKTAVSRDSFSHRNLFWDHRLLLLAECNLKKKDDTAIFPGEKKQLSQILRS